MGKYDLSQECDGQDVKLGVGDMWIVVYHGSGVYQAVTDSENMLCLNQGNMLYAVSIIDVWYFEVEVFRIINDTYRRSHIEDFLVLETEREAEASYFEWKTSFPRRWWIRKTTIVRTGRYGAADKRVSLWRFI